MSQPELFFLSRKFLFEFISSVLNFHSWFVASCRSQPGSSSSIYSVRPYLCVGIYLLTNYMRKLTNCKKYKAKKNT